MTPTSRRRLPRFAVAHRILTVASFGAHRELKAVSEAQAAGWRPGAGPIFVEISAQKAKDIARAGSIAVVVTGSGAQFEFGDFLHNDLPACETR